MNTKSVVLGVLEERGPSTVREVMRETGYHFSLVGSCLNDLRRNGVVYIPTKRKCGVTGAWRNAYGICDPSCSDSPGVNTQPLGLKVSREECTENAWALLDSRAETIQQLRTDLVKAYKRLCKYEGHLPITAPDGTQHCELCESEI